jgi:anaphase-promoting complex subunit 2
VKVDCKTYHAAVIYAFGDEGDEGGVGPGSAPARRTATELEETLQMDDDLLGEALSFWVGQRVLRDEGGGSYVVMETLEDASGGEAASASAGAGAGPATPAKKAGRAMTAKEVQQRQVYWQFIKGMLTNSAAMMPVGQIAMMLKMLIPDGFPWANDELQDFLASKVQEGELEFAGGKYKLVRK